MTSRRVYKLTSWLRVFSVKTINVGDKQYKMDNQSSLWGGGACAVYALSKSAPENYISFDIKQSLQANEVEFRTIWC